MSKDELARSIWEIETELSEIAEYDQRLPLLDLLAALYAALEEGEDE